jgi:hypothetical protein
VDKLAGLTTNGHGNSPKWNSYGIYLDIQQSYGQQRTSGFDKSAFNYPSQDEI